MPQQRQTKTDITHLQKTTDQSSEVHRHAICPCGSGNHSKVKTNHWIQNAWIYVQNQSKNHHNPKHPKIQNIQSFFSYVPCKAMVSGSDPQSGTLSDTVANRLQHCVGTLSKSFASNCSVPWIVFSDRGAYDRFTTIINVNQQRQN